MLIRYLDTMRTRVVGEYQWDRANGHEVNVAEAQLIADLITQPDPDAGWQGNDRFEISPNEPLLQWLTAEQIAQLVLEIGVTSVETFVTLKAQPVKQAGALLGVKPSEVAGWIQQMNTFLSNPPSVGTAEVTLVEG